MESAEKNIAILNLTGKLPQEIENYFSHRGIMVVDPLKESKEVDWTHIITKDIFDFSLIAKNYDVLKNDIKLISLSKVEDLQNFSMYNGNLVLDESWFQHKIAPFILDKYFQNHHHLKVTNDYAPFKELGSFNIANPFSTGEYSDLMVQHAFEHSVDALSVRTYFDHFLMFMAGLKSKGKAGLPFEVTYGAQDDIFSLQIHFFSPKLALLDLASSLKSSLSKKVEEYFLNLAIQSSDFFDFTFLPHVNKSIVTAMWLQKERVTFENRGLMFSSLMRVNVMESFENSERLSPLKQLNSSIEDFSEKVNISNFTSSNGPDTFVVKGSSQTLEHQESLAEQNLSDDSGAKMSNVNQQGQASSVSEFEHNPLVLDELQKLDKLDSEELVDEVRIVRGETPLNDFVSIVKGKFDEQQVSLAPGEGSSQIDIDKVVFHIASNVDQAAKEENLKIRSMSDLIFPEIKKGFFDFTKGIHKSFDEIKVEDIDLFQSQIVPEIIRTELLKLHPEENPKYLDYPPELIAELEEKLLKTETENDKLKSQLKTLFTEFTAIKDANKKIKDLYEIAPESSSEVLSPNELNDEGEEGHTTLSPIYADCFSGDDKEFRDYLSEKIQQNKDISVEDAKRLGELLDKEAKFIANLKEFEFQLERSNAEKKQKEALFVKEIEKAEKAVKAKDLVALKQREAFKKLMEKKEKELKEKKLKIERLARIVSTGINNSHLPKLRELERQNQRYQKQVELYKSKVSALSARNIAQRNEKPHKNEMRKYQIFIQELKIRLNDLRQDYDRVFKQAQNDRVEIERLKAEKEQMEIFFKESAQEEKDNNSSLDHSDQSDKLASLQSELDKTQQLVKEKEKASMNLVTQNEVLNTQLKDSADKIKNLEEKLEEALKAAKGGSGADDGTRVKMGRMESSVKKLSQDLADSKKQLNDAKKEANKLRQEKTALQNQLDKMTKSKGGAKKSRAA